MGLLVKTSERRLLQKGHVTVSQLLTPNGLFIVKYVTTSC